MHKCVFCIGRILADVGLLPADVCVGLMPIKRLWQVSDVWRPVINHEIMVRPGGTQL